MYFFILILIIKQKHKNRVLHFGFINVQTYNFLIFFLALSGYDFLNSLAILIEKKVDFSSSQTLAVIS